MNKKAAIALVLTLTASTAFAQSNDSHSHGVAQIEPVITVWNALIAGTATLNPSVSIYLSRHLAVPIDVALSYWGYGIGFTAETGIEITPFQEGPAGLLFILKGGLGYGITAFGGAISLQGHIDVGWRFILDDGFIFSPSIGFSLAGFPLDVNLPIGYSF